MGAFLGYMSFSLIEGLAVYALILSIFRFPFMKFIWPIVLMVTATNLQSFFIRDELALTTISPIINSVITILFLAIFMRIPVIWSMVMTVTGYLAFGVLQSSIIMLSNGYLSLGQAQEFVWKVYLIQLITGVLGTSISWLLYKLGYGFSFEFEKLRLKWERAFVILLLIGFLIGLGIMMYFKAIFTNFIVFAIALFIFLSYSLRKEQSE